MWLSVWQVTHSYKGHITQCEDHHTRLEEIEDSYSKILRVFYYFFNIMVYICWSIYINFLDANSSHYKAANSRASWNCRAPYLNIRNFKITTRLSWSMGTLLKSWPWWRHMGYSSSWLGHEAPKLEQGRGSVGTAGFFNLCFPKELTAYWRIETRKKK